MTMIPDDAPIILTASGLHVTPLSLTPEMIRIEDVAHHLGNLCRFTGATREFYSVAQHSVLVSHIAPVGLRLPALLHDASEYIHNDICRPLKHSPWYGRAVRDVEHAAQRIICAAFDLPWPEPPEIKEIDKRILANEARDLLPPEACRDWEILRGVEPYPMDPIEPWLPKEARERFLRRYYELRGGRKQ